MTERSPAALPAGTAVGPVRLRVPGVDAVLPFYRDLLGMRELRREGDAIALAPAGSEDALVILEPRAGVRNRPERTLGLYHYALLLPDRLHLGRTLMRLFEARYPFSGFADHGVSEAAYLADPAGNGIELAADRPPGQWVWRGDQVAMTTLALNVTDLLRRVDGDPWHGLPAGTTIGHVHLHVSDLARAEHFYHQLLGFDVTARNYPGALFLAARGYHHHIGVNTWASSGSARDHDVAGMVGFAVRIPSSDGVEAVLGRLRDAGAPLDDTPHGWRTEDADGNGVFLAHSGTDAAPR